MVETVVALLLFLNGNMVEHVYKDSLKVCNESKKIAEQVVNPLNVTFVCKEVKAKTEICLLYTSPSPRDATLSRMPSSA